MTGNFYALLIGVDFYLPNRLKGGGTYRSLNGCVRDVARVETYLRNTLRVPPTCITRLTSTPGRSGRPAEPAAQVPSYENIVSACKALAAQAGPGDRVYVHYSGHGGRTTTAFPEIKGQDGLDEALVPYDIGNSDARYVRDVELGALLKNIADKQALLTVVLDSCHSGGATRGQRAGVSTAVRRGMDPGSAVMGGKAYDATERPTESSVGTHDELVAAWGPLPSGQPGQRGVKPGSGWLQQVQAYTLLAACRANESAYEDVFEGNDTCGALTYWLLRSLPSMPPGASYKVLQDRLLARIRTSMPDQTPQLQGESDRLIFGAQDIAQAYGILVTGVDLANKKVSLNAGEAHGLRRGTLLGVYPNGATDLTDAAGRQAVVEVTDLVGDVDSNAGIVTDSGRGALEPGAQAVVIGSTDQRLQRAIALALPKPEPAESVQQALAADRSGFVRLAAAGEPADFQVGIAGDCYEIWDRNGTPVPNLLPPILTSASDGAAAVVRRLVHLVKFNNVLGIENTDPDMSKRVAVELQGPQLDEGRAFVYPPGVPLTLKITNLLKPNPADVNDPERILNVTVLMLAYDYSIKQIHPPPQEGPFVIVQPGESIPLDFVTEVASGLDEETDILKVFVTQKTTDFRSLLLGKLDEPPIPRTRRAQDMDDPLDRLLASFAGDQAPDRQELRLRLKQVNTPKAPRPWATSQVEVSLKKA